MMLDSLNAEFESIVTDGRFSDYGSEDLDEQLFRRRPKPLGPAIPAKVPTLEEFDVRKAGIGQAGLSYREMSQEFLEEISFSRPKWIDFGDLDVKFKRKLSFEIETAVSEGGVDASDFEVGYNQLFPLDTSFVISNDLQRKYVNSALVLRSASGISTSEVLQMASSGDLLSELSRKIRAQLVSWAQSKRNKSPQTVSVFKDGSFNPFLQISICDALLIVPDFCKAFLTQLADDLKSYLNRDGRFFGEWGELELTQQGEILLRATELGTESQRSIKKSRRLE